MTKYVAALCLSVAFSAGCGSDTEGCPNPLLCGGMPWVADVQPDSSTSPDAGSDHDSTSSNETAGPDANTNPDVDPDVAKIQEVCKDQLWMEGFGTVVCDNVSPFCACDLVPGILESGECGFKCPGCWTDVMPVSLISNNEMETGPNGTKCHAQLEVICYDDYSQMKDMNDTIWDCSAGAESFSCPFGSVVLEYAKCGAKCGDKWQVPADSINFGLSTDDDKMEFKAAGKDYVCTKHKFPPVEEVCKDYMDLKLEGVKWECDNEAWSCTTKMVVLKSGACGVVCPGFWEVPADTLKFPSADELVFDDGLSGPCTCFKQ